jgi:hypothetical protein
VRGCLARLRWVAREGWRRRCLTPRPFNRFQHSDTKSQRTSCCFRSSRRLCRHDPNPDSDFAWPIPAKAYLGLGMLVDPLPVNKIRPRSVSTSTDAFSVGSRYGLRLPDGLRLPVAEPNGRRNSDH